MLIAVKPGTGMGVVDTLRRAVSTERGLYECRHCGTKRDREIASCPNCGADEIAHYEL